MQKEAILTARILNALIDDEEFLEEIYLSVAFEQHDTVFRAYKPSFRLTEIVERLLIMRDNGLVRVRETEGFSADYGLCGATFSLTQHGRKAWERVVPENRDEIFELAER